MVHEPRGGEVQHAEARLPRPQAPVDVLIGHPVALVEQPNAVDHRPAHVHARAGDRERGARAPGRAPIRRFEAVAVVEPLWLIAVAHGAAELDAPIRVLQLRTDDACVLVAVCRVLQALEPAGQRLDVGVQYDHVARSVCGPQPAIDVRGKAGVALALDHDIDPLDRAQLRQVLRAAAVVGDDQTGHARPGRLTDAAHERAHTLRVSVAGDHDVHRRAVLAVPRDRGA